MAKKNKCREKIVERIKILNAEIELLSQLLKEIDSMDERRKD